MEDDDDDLNIFGRKVVPLKKKKERPSPEGWRAMLHISEGGTPLPNLHNTMLVMRNSPALVGIVGYDEMSLSPSLTRAVPGAVAHEFYPRRLADADVLAIQEYIQMSDLRRVPKATVQDAIDLIASQNRSHPIRDSLDALKWDGKKRLDTWLARYLGAEAGVYASTIGRLFLIAMVARVYQPGCQADYMLVLEGPQGAWKSSACRILAGGARWFSDNLPDLSRADPVRLSMHLRDKWLIEIAEMSAFNAAEVHKLKEFLTQKEERYTPKYGRQEVCEPRQCVFIGSTNEATYLQDATGARRFWPIKVGIIDLIALERDRDQLLAEAVAEYRAGAVWYPSRDFEAEFIVPEQEARYEVDPWEEIVAEYVNHGGAAHQSEVKVTDVLVSALFIETGRITSRETRRMSKILGRLGWTHFRTMHGRGFSRPKVLRK